MAENKLRIVEQTSEYANGSLILPGNVAITGNVIVNGSNVPLGIISANTSNVNVSIAANGWQTIDLSVSSLALSNLTITDSIIASSGVTADREFVYGSFVLHTVVASGTYAGVAFYSNAQAGEKQLSNAHASWIMDLGGRDLTSGYPDSFTISRKPSGNVANDGLANGAVVLLEVDNGGNLLLPQAELKLLNQYAGIEHGSTSVAGTPYIDFHSSGNNIDYDVRMIASGGNTTTGQGYLDVYCSDFGLNNISLIKPSWTPVTFGANCTNYGGAYAPCAYYQDPSGRVHLRGLLQTNGNIASGQNIVSGIPAPLYQAIFCQYTSAGAQRCDATQTGAVEWLGSALGSGNWISLEGISYQTK